MCCSIFVFSLGENPFFVVVGGAGRMDLFSGEYGVRPWKKRGSLLLSPFFSPDSKREIKEWLGFSIYITLHVVNRNAEIIIIILILCKLL